MKNKTIFMSLDKKTQDYLRIVYSLINYFSYNDMYYRVTNGDDETLYFKLDDGHYIIGLSFFLAGLYIDGFTKDLFASKGITFEECLKYIKKSDDTVKFKLLKEDLFDSEVFGLIDLESYLGNIAYQIKEDYYLRNKDFSINDLEPYQIFDYSMVYYNEVPEDIMAEMFDIEDFGHSDLFMEYQSKREEVYGEMAKDRYNVDIFNSEHKNTIWEFDFDRFKLINDEGCSYLIPKDNNNIKVKVFDEENDSIDIKSAEILRINGKDLTYESFKEILSLSDSSFLELTIVDVDGIERIFKTRKGELFMKPQTETQNNNDNNKKSSILDKYGEDLTKLSYIKDPSIGRDEDIRKIEQILLYPERDKSVIITGESGVGKTALVKGLAYRIKNGNVPYLLKYLKIISIDTATIVAGTKYVGSLEEKLKKILDEASKDKTIILFIDEIHQTIGGGKSDNDSNSVAEILKPYLDSGKVRVIGATTTEEYMEHISSNPAFKTRFKKIDIKEPTNDTIYTILDDLINTYNEISGCTLDALGTNRSNIINSLIAVTKKSYRDYKDPSNNPRLVIDILKEAYAIAAINDRDVVTMDDIKLAVMDEERLYKSAREKYSSIVKSEEQKDKGKILEFRPKKQ